MTDQSQITANKGNGKAYTAFLATAISTYGMNYMSLHGVDFQVFGVPSEIIKSGIDASLLMFFTWASPDHLVQSVTDSILFVKSAFKQWGDALSNKPDQLKE